MSLRWWFHKHRGRHDSRMAEAESHVERAAFHVREANRYSKGMSVDYADSAKSHGVRGFEEIRAVIAIVVDCGCPRNMWSEQVQERIPEMSRRVEYRLVEGSDE